MNFQKEEIFDNQVTKGLMDLDSELGHILDNEEKLKHKILKVHIELRQNRNTYNFMITKMYKLQELQVMLERSVMMDELDLLDRAVFHRTRCQLDLCELQIYSEQRGSSVWVHRKLVELVWSQCLAKFWSQRIRLNELISEWFFQF